MNISCDSCEYNLSDTDLWLEVRKCRRCRGPDIEKRIKYDCPKCNFYSGWFTISEECKKCVENVKEFEKRHIRGDDFTFEVSDVCMESCPCQHSVKYIYEDGFDHGVCMSGPGIALLYKTHGLEIPSHFKEYLFKK